MSSLIEILDDKVIPWASGQAGPRIIMTGPAAGRMELAESVRVTKKKLVGPRQASVGKRGSETNARWPADGLIETKGGPFIICIVGGHVDFQVGERVVHCGEGYFILVPPGVPLDDGNSPHYEIDPQLPVSNYSCDLLWLVRNAHGIRCWICNSRGTMHRAQREQLCQVRSEVANQLLDLLLEEAEIGEDGWQGVCHDYLHASLVLIRRAVAEGKVLDAGLMEFSQVQKGPYQDAIERAQHYIRTHLKYDPTVQETAQHVFMSRTLFLQRFRQQVGQSFSEFRTQCRMEEAQTLLRNSDWSVTRISQKVGLKSLSYFCAQFQRHQGMTPQEFRDRTRTDSVANLAEK